MSATTACTTIEEQPEYARLPSASKGYLIEKALTTFRLAKFIAVFPKNGTPYYAAATQICMAGLVYGDERKAYYAWRYKPEVVYDMSPTVDKKLPIPYLSKDSKYPAPNRRRSRNPFRIGSRRPDLVIVKNPLLLWPGLETADHTGEKHPDNILRVVEMKFPGDKSISDKQADAYKLLVGNDARRLSVIDINDCNNDLEGRKSKLPALEPAAKSREATDKQKLILAPIRTTNPLPSPVYFSPWVRFKNSVHEAEQKVYSLTDGMQKGFNQISQDAQNYIKKQAVWISQTGHWVYNKSQQTWRWINQTGQVAAQWTEAQLHTAWLHIERQTDLTWQQLKAIEWTQVLYKIGEAICVVVMIAGVALAFIFGGELLAAFLALIGITSTATA